MTLDIEAVVDQKNLKPSLTVMGVGGAGSNAVNNMIQSNLDNVDFIVANTDAQALENSLCYNRIQLGLEQTKGLGAGADPIVGKDSAEESVDLISEELRNTNMLFFNGWFRWRHWYRCFTNNIECCKKIRYSNRSYCFNSFQL